MRALILAVALLAGCAAPEASPEADVVRASAISSADCEQTHTFVPFPMEAFAGMLPEGWALQPADPAGRTTQFYLAGSRCATASASSPNTSATIEELKEVWGYLFVIPPEGANDSLDGELWPLGGVVSHGDALRVYEAWGLGGVVVQGGTEILVTVAGPALTSRTWAANDEESFEVDASAPAQEAAFHDGAFRIWIPADDEDGVDGSILYAWPEGGTDLGLGSGTMRYAGPLLNAPPATPAVVHHVRGVSANATAFPR